MEFFGANVGIADFAPDNDQPRTFFATLTGLEASIGCYCPEQEISNLTERLMTFLEPANDARQRIKSLVQAIKRLPPPPVPLAQASSEASRKAISRFIAQDIPMARRFIAWEKSAHQGASDSEIFEKAMARFDESELLGFVLERHLHRTLFGDTRLSDPLIVGLRSHSLACASASRLLAEKIAPELAGEAFAGGLVHDCGKALLLHLHPERYARVIQSSDTPGKDVRALEVVNFGLDHAVAGKWMLEHWKAPPSVIDATWLHHHKPVAVRDPLARPAVLAFVALGDILARSILSEAVCAEDHGRAKGLAKQLGIAADVVYAVRDGIPEAYCALAGLLDLDPGIVAFYRTSLARAHKALAQRTGERPAKRDEPNLPRRFLSIVGRLGPRLASAVSPSEIFSQIHACISEMLPEYQGGLAFSENEGEDFDGMAWNGRSSHGLRIPAGRPELPSGVAPLLAGLIGKALAKHAATARPAQGKRQETFSEHGYAALLDVDERSRCLFVIGIDKQPFSGHEQVLWSLRQIADLACAHLGRLKTLAALADRSRELSSALNRLEKARDRELRSERLAAIGHAAAGTAQEINNPLSIISARTQLLERQENDQQKKRSLRQMLTQVERITGTLQNLMDFARPPQPSFERTSLNGLVEECLTLAGHNRSRPGVAITSQLAGDLPDVMVDRAQIKRLIVNLLVNAVNAVEQRGNGDITVTTRLGLNGSRIVLGVRDTGVGIPREMLPRVFDPFFTTGGGRSSLGLGLSICHGIASNHHGSLDVSSREGEWTELTLTLPTKDQPRRAAGPDASVLAPLHSPATMVCDVLVAEPDPVMRDALAFALEQAGHQVDAVADAAEALDLLSRFEYRLAVLNIDLNISEASFVATARKAFPEMIAVALVEDESAFRIPEAMALGVQACARKPIHVAGLAERIGNLLRPGKAG